MITTAPSPTAPLYRPGAQRVGALLDLHGVGFFKLADSLTGYGRPTGYDSLANARRAAYRLSVGATSPAAGVFQMGDRFYVRALIAAPGISPHAVGNPTSGAASAGAQAGHALLHFEGNKDAHFAWVADARLVLMVDGSTKIWSKDAHHAPPAQLPSL